MFADPHIASAGQPVEAGAAGHNGRVLLVEDDRVAAFAAAAALTELGYHVTHAEDGAQAYLLLRENPDCADVVLTDRFMPALDGIGLTRRLRREPRTRNKPIVMMTGANDRESIAEGIVAGVFQYLTKPIDSFMLSKVMLAAFAEVVRHQAARKLVLQHQAGFASLHEMTFKLRRPDEVVPVCSLLASLAPDADKVAAGLRELVSNALEFGLCGLDHAEKLRLKSDGRLDEEIAARLAGPDYPGEVVAVGSRMGTTVRFVIRDPGPGFAWQNALRADPSASVGLASKGLIRAARVFKQIQFNREGNIVAGTVSTAGDSIW